MNYLKQLFTALFSLQDLTMDEQILEKEFSVARRTRLENQTSHIPPQFGWMRV